MLESNLFCWARTTCACLLVRLKDNVDLTNNIVNFFLSLICMNIVKYAEQFTIEEYIIYGVVVSTLSRLRWTKSQLLTINF